MFCADDEEIVLSNGSHHWLVGETGHFCARPSSFGLSPIRLMLTILDWAGANVLEHC